MVKPDITDPITGIALGGRQGRLLTLEEEKGKLDLQWDSVTLKHLSSADILEREAMGVSWSAMYLAIEDVLPATARDREEDVAATLADLERQYSWLSLGEQGKRIRAIVNREEQHDFLTSSLVWHAYLEEHLAVPFVAKMIQSYDRGPVKQGDQVTVRGISLLDSSCSYGTIVKVRRQRRVYHLPLRDLQAMNAPAEVGQLIEDYATWISRHSLIYARRTYGIY